MAMRSLLMSLILTLTLTVGVLAQNNEQPSESAEQQLRAVINRLTEAGLKKDVSALDKIYADNYFHTNPDGTILTKSQVLDIYKAEAKFTVTNSTHDDEKVLVFQDTAVFNDRVILTIESNGKNFVRIYRVTYVLIKKAGNWQVITSHSSIIS